MPQTTLCLKGKKNPSPIHLRFWESKTLDFTIKTGLVLNPAHWDKKHKKIKNVIDVPNRVELNAKLTKLQLHVIDEYNNAYSDGGVIDRVWLEKAVNSFFSRPTGEDKLKIEPHKIYLSDYADWWLENVAPTYKVKANKYMDEVTKTHYNKAIDNFKAFEGKDKVRLTDTTLAVMDKFSVYLSNDENYTPQTAKRKVGRMKFFCDRAVNDGLKVNKGYNERVFVQEEKINYKHPYLNPDEIKIIAKLDLSHDKALDYARDWLLVGVWTGMRISDFMGGLTLDNIEGNYIRITTKKTGHTVVVPLHDMVRKVLEKYNGLPPKMADQTFNERIKIVGQLAEIDNEITGGIVTVEKKGEKPRKVVGLYKKYLLMTSHICRRSFATNLFGKVPNKVIMDVCGWKKEEMLLKYIKTSNMESAVELEKYWEKSIQ